MTETPHTAGRADLMLPVHPSCSHPRFDVAHCAPGLVSTFQGTSGGFAVLLLVVDSVVVVTSVVSGCRPCASPPLPPPHVQHIVLAPFPSGPGKWPKREHACASDAYQRQPSPSLSLHGLPSNWVLSTQTSKAGVSGADVDVGASVDCGGGVGAGVGIGAGVGGATSAHLQIASLPYF